MLKTLQKEEKGGKLQIIGKSENILQVVLDTLSNIRGDAEAIFHGIFESMQTLMSNFGTELEMPRLCGHQTQRANVESSDCETYYRITVFLPFLDHMITELHARFDEKLRNLAPLQGLIPTKLSQYTDQQIIEAAKIYSSDLNVFSLEETLSAELLQWRNKWKAVEKLPTTAVEVMFACNFLTCNIKVLLHLLALLPVSTASAK